MDYIIFIIKILFIGISKLKIYCFLVILKRNKLMDILLRYVIQAFVEKMMIMLIPFVEPLLIWLLRSLEKVSIAIKLIFGLQGFLCIKCFLEISHSKVTINFIKGMNMEYEINSKCNKGFNLKKMKVKANTSINKDTF